MIFYPGSVLNNDPGNWWGPNPQCVYEILKECGFQRIYYQNSPGYDVPGTPGYRTRGIYHAFRNEDSFASIADESFNKWLDLSDAEVRRDLFAPFLQT